MRGLFKLKVGPGNYELRADVEEPRPGPGEAVVRVKAAGVCGSDLHVYHGDIGCKTPLIVGHEFSGEVLRVGEGVRGARSGDRVISELHVGACGACWYCAHDLRQFCPKKTPPGWGVDGCFADQVKVPASLLHRIPDGVPFEVAAMAEPMAITIYSVLERTGIGKGDFVAILGPGPIGLLSIVTARYGGAGRVAVVGTSRRGTLRLEMARALGADVVIDASKEDPVARIRAETGGIGADVVVEAAGGQTAISQAIEMVRRAGRIAGVAISDSAEVSIPWNTIVQKVISLHTSWSSPSSAWKKALEIMAAEKERLQKVITHRLPLERWEDAFKLLDARQAIKCLLVP